MNAKSWFNLHSWAGLFVGVLLFVTCVSGTLATLSHELEYLTDAKYRALSSSASTNYQAIENTLNKHYPQGQLLYIQRHKQDYLATEAALKVGDSFRFVYLDAATGRLLGEGEWARISRFLRNWHMNLSMGWTGKLIVTSLSMLLVILLVSSFYVYRRWWQGFMKKPAALSLDKRSSWADWHKLLGLWSLWFIVVMAITGVWYLVEHGLQTAKVSHTVSASQAVSEFKKQSPRKDISPISLTAAYEAAQQAFPSLDIRYIRYPNKADQPIEVRGYNDDILLRLRANRVYLKPSSGELLGIQIGEQLPIVARISDTADPLHFGNFAGVGTKLIWGLFGALMSFISAAGMYMSWLRVKRKTTAVKWLGVSGGIAIGLVVASLLTTSLSFTERSVPNQVYSPILG
ncbi:PepSY domain-containing protein [Pseudoalteromonas sp. OFAV1]|uniref:PepSY-associated TM helix domain-containing protein n=1 Tax=Pseudoalteromonas sp. OFAV1 TaxID=2908892 RepID=UPI001F21DDD9|nr:PepSY-associated TM helix domain-containing protein [Pseudoalteromonas sp. OFAV1]MCF2902895.1 PepSY domain-containing protein [Pseudoalteromonas sp. OFAV1]